MSYTHYTNYGVICHDTTGRVIDPPFDPLNPSSEYASYTRWLFDGNTPAKSSLPPPSATDITKLIRQSLLDDLKVTTPGGYAYDADERSQGRMSRAIAATADGVLIEWVMADNALVLITKAELQSALDLAVAETTRIWVSPYKS